MFSPQLIQTQTAASGQSVSVWKEAAAGDPDSGWVFRKVWQSPPADGAKAWLSWAHHEHLVLTLLAHADVGHVVQVAGLQVHAERVEVVTHDAGPDFRRDWLDQLSAPTLLSGQADALKLARACLRALQEVHALGVVHGDVKADNVCVRARPVRSGENTLQLDLGSLRLIDFAYAVYRERPLKFVLPTDPDRLDYLPDFYRAAIRQAQTEGDPAPIQRAACAQVDIFSLYRLMREVVPEASVADGAAWQCWLNACAEACAEPASAQAMDTPTSRLLALSETLLRQLQEPPTQWEEAVTTLPLRRPEAAVTPLLLAQATPALTPLLVVTQAPAALNDVQGGPALAPASVTQPPAGERGWRLTPVALLLLAGVFAFVDRRFEESGVVLTDLGFVLGLLAMAMAPLVVAAGVWHVWTASHRARRWMHAPVLGLCAIAAYFLVMLFPQGVSAILLGLLLLLLALLAWAWLARLFDRG